jgi:hypothetical protein
MKHAELIENQLLKKISNNDRVHSKKVVFVILHPSTNSGQAL